MATWRRRLESLLPAQETGARPPKWTKRQLIDGIRRRGRVGSPWRDVPPQYGAWQTVYGLFGRWQRDGTWQRILSGLQARADAAGPITWDVKRNRGVATRFGKPAARYQATVTIAAISEWLLPDA